MITHLAQLLEDVHDVEDVAAIEVAAHIGVLH